MKRIEQQVDAGADQIAQRRRSAKRQVHVGARIDAVAPERHPELVVVMRQAELAGDIDQAEHAHGRIGHEPLGCDARLLEPKLQHVVDEDRWLRQVDQHIVQAATDRAGRQRTKNLGHRADQVTIQRALDGVVGAVELLPRIFPGRRRHGRGRRALRPGRRRPADDRRGEQCAQGVAAHEHPLKDPIY